MHFTISRESILKPLQLAAGVVERRHTLPVLANVLLSLEGDQLSITGTDLEVELVGKVTVDPGATGGEITVPARKLMDICKSLAEDAQLDFRLEDNKLVLKSGRSRYTLTTLPATDFPNAEDDPDMFSLALEGAQVKALLDSTSFAMAQQDVRYYLNGMLFEVEPEHLRVVATDGHRLAMRTLKTDTGASESIQVILPRKAVLELGRLLGDENESLTMMFGSNHVRVKLQHFTFTSKLVDGKFPDYTRVLPRGGNKIVIGEKHSLRHAFSRASILSNEKYRGVHLHLISGELKILANNPEQEEAEEVVGVEYEGDSLEIGFNVAYLVDVLNALDSEKVKITLLDANSSALLEEVSDADAVYVVMPMRL